MADVKTDVKKCLDTLEKTKAKPASHDPERKEAFEKLFDLLGIDMVQCKGGQLIAR